MCKANCGLKIDSVVRTKRQFNFASSIMGKTYVIKYLCNGIVGIADIGNIDNMPHLNTAENLVCIGRIKKCIEFKDKTLCLI